MLTNQYAQTFASLGTQLASSPLSGQRYFYINEALAQQWQITTSQIESWLSMAQPIDGFAMKYTGHQFGHYNPELGDGRGLLIGEWQHQGRSLDIHLKGSGQTPYSRMGDGRAVTRSTIREYLMGEFLTSLGIASTRALGLASFNQKAMREQPEPTAVLLRATPCHIRFGHFEYLANTGQSEQLNKLIDYVGQQYFEQADITAEQFLIEVAKRTGSLLAQWQSYGFCHGVMNTDNMSIIGETFDFGPFALMAAFDPNHICNHTDTSGRYAFDQQPAIALWNLQVLAQAISSIAADLDVQAIMRTFIERFNHQYLTQMALRLGVVLTSDDQDLACLEHLHSLLTDQQADLNQFLHYRQTMASSEALKLSSLRPVSASATAKANQLDVLLSSKPQQPSAGNPAWVLRNGLIQQVIDNAEQGNWHPFEVVAEACNNANHKAAYNAAREQGIDLNTGQAEISTRLSCSS